MSIVACKILKDKIEVFADPIIGYEVSRKNSFNIKSL